MPTSSYHSLDIPALFASHPDLPEVVDTKLLSGGMTNSVTRCFTKDGSTVVAKRFWPFSVTGGSDGVQLSLKRSEAEHVAITHIPSLHPTVAAPTLIVFLHLPASDSEHGESTVMVSSDAGRDSITLKNLLLNRSSSLPSQTFPQLGRDIGQWLARLHTHFSATTEEGKTLRRKLADVDAGNWELWFSVTSGRLEDCYPGTWPEGVVAKIVAAEGKSGGTDDTMPGATVIMGDFWTGNILVDVKDSGEDAHLTVVDWELARPGMAWQDLGQMTAEMYLCVCFAATEEARRNAQAVLEAFHSGYREEIGRNGGQVEGAAWEESVKMALMHAAVHIVVWPQYSGWEPMEKVRELQRWAVGFLEELVDEKMAWKKRVRKEGFEELLG